MTSRSSSSQNQPQPRLKPSSVVYWMRVGLAILAGITVASLHIDVATFGDLADVLGILVGVAFYAFSVVMVRYVFHYGEAELRGKSKDITLGGGTFIFLWIMVTILCYTLGL